jgi:hypothetical protein
MGLSYPIERSAVGAVTRGLVIRKLINGRIEGAFDKDNDTKQVSNVWMDERDYRKADCGDTLPFLNPEYKGCSYPTGWHILVDEAEAKWVLDHLARSYKDLVLVPVEIADIRAVGKQSYKPNNYGEPREYMKTVVAGKIKILGGSVGMFVCP